jgi:RNA polymerase sigma factor (sigma-70 family)
LPPRRRGLRLRRPPSKDNRPGGRISAAESIGRAEHADATRDLFVRHARQVFGFCFSRLGSREEAEDAVQSTYLNAHRALQRGVVPESELAWLLKIAQNVCLTRRRSTRRRFRVEAAQDIDSMQDYLPAPAQDSADELIRLDDALAQLPESQRRAILLREWQGLSYAEIARELRLTQSAVETLIFRARRSLATNLETAFERPRVLARVRHALELGWLAQGLKALLEGGIAAKTATAAVALSSAAVLATSPSTPPAPSTEAKTAPAVATAAAPVVARVERPRMVEPNATALVLTPRARAERSRVRSGSRARATAARNSPAALPATAAERRVKVKEKRHVADAGRVNHAANAGRAKTKERVRSTTKPTTKPTRRALPAPRPPREPKPKAKVEKQAKEPKPAVAPPPPAAEAQPVPPGPPEKDKGEAKTK